MFQDLELDINNDIYLSFQSPIPGQSGVYLSSNNGYLWTHVGLSSSYPINCLAIDSSGYVYAGSNYQGIFRAPGRTVPVELISFTCEVEEDIVTLFWQTATETNNAGFEVERLQDSMIEKLQDWKRIGFVEGKGTTTENQNYFFTDKPETGKYKYRLKQIDFDGSFEYSIEVGAEVLPPLIFSLEQNFPNPFNPRTTISWQSPAGSWQTLKIYDILGNEVATLVDEYRPAGKYEVEFDASSLPSGIYFYKLQAGSYIETKKMVLLK